MKWQTCTGNKEMPKGIVVGENYLNNSPDLGVALSPNIPI
jgi:hypothetical protein